MDATLLWSGLAVVAVIVVVVIMAGCALSNTLYHRAQVEDCSQLAEPTQPKQRIQKYVGTQSRSDEALNWGAH